MLGDWRDLKYMRKAKVGRLLSPGKCLGRFRGDDNIRLSRKTMGSIKRNPTVDRPRTRAAEENVHRVPVVGEACDQTWAEVVWAGFGFPDARFCWNVQILDQKDRRPTRFSDMMFQRRWFIYQVGEDQLHEVEVVWADKRGRDRVQSLSC